MKRCANCGLESNDSVEVCPGCGLVLGAADSTHALATSKGRTFFSFCGLFILGLGLCVIGIGLAIPGVVWAVYKVRHLGAVVAGAVAGGIIVLAVPFLKIGVGLLKVATTPLQRQLDDRVWLPVLSIIFLVGMPVGLPGLIGGIVALYKIKMGGGPQWSKVLAIVAIFLNAVETAFVVIWIIHSS